MATKDEVLRRLERWEGHLAVAIWTRLDVQEKAEQKNLRITDEDADLILDRLDAGHDAEYGITWDTIDYAIDALFEECQSCRRHPVLCKCPGGAIKRERPEIGRETCSICGESVAEGSGNFANRIPDDSDYQTRRDDLGRPHPEGEWLCETCNAEELEL